MSLTSQIVDEGFSIILSPTHDFLDVELSNSPPVIWPDEGTKSIQTTISASEDAVSGTYKILFGAQSPDIAISKFVTVTIE